jgi:hypothetical protein
MATLFDEAEKTIGLASDHAGYQAKQYVIKVLEEKGIPYKDFGTYSPESSDYADYAHPLATAVENGECYPGIAIAEPQRHQHDRQKTSGNKSRLVLDSRNCFLSTSTQRC